MNTPEASAQIFAVGLQESKFQHRVQVTEGPRLRQWWVGGPARSLWQMEGGAVGGCAQILKHAGPHLAVVLKALHYPADIDPNYLHGLIAHNDVLAAACARLLLWTDPRPLPADADGPEASWQCYIRNWKPGKPHRNTWNAYHAEGWRRATAP